MRQPIIRQILPVFMARNLTATPPESKASLQADVNTPESVS